MFGNVVRDQFEFHYLGYFPFFGFCYVARHIFYGHTSRRQGIRFIVFVSYTFGNLSMSSITALLFQLKASENLHIWFRQILVVLASPLNKLVVACVFLLKPWIPYVSWVVIVITKTTTLITCTIIFITKIHLWFQIKQELHAAYPPGTLTRTVPWICWKPRWSPDILLY